jgi:hypothetical protein
MAERRKKAGRKAGDGLENDFGPGFDPAPEASKDATGAGPTSRDADVAAGFAGIPCGKDGCFLKPVGDLVTRFAFELARRGHADSASRAATSGIELLRALRDFLDEEIAFAERAAEKQRSSARYTKIPVD